MVHQMAILMVFGNLHFSLKMKGYFVIDEWRWWILSSVMKCQKWTNQHDTSVGQESNPWPPKHRAGALSTKLQEVMKSKVIKLSSYATGVLHTARISTVEVIASVINEWRWWILSSVMKCERWTNQLARAWNIFCPKKLSSSFCHALAYLP